MEEQKIQQPADVSENSPKPGKKKRRFRNLLIFLLVVAAIWWFGNYSITYPKYKVYSDKIAEPFTIAVLSDYHASGYSIGIDRIVSGIDRKNPDIVCILGDMYSLGSDDDIKAKAVELAADIVGNGYPVYFVPGEHDHDSIYLEQLRDSGVHVMDYNEEYTVINGNNVRILGIDNAYYSSTFDLANAFERDESCFNILLAHIPNYDKFSKFGTDITLCGDTHGGIIQLPFGRGPAYDADSGEWFPELFGSRSDIYDKGLFPYTGGTMFVTSGLGAYPFPARFNNLPEIAIITVNPSQG